MGNGLFDQTASPVEPVTSHVAPPTYVGFWYRASAFLLDAWLLLLMMGVLSLLVMSSEFTYYYAWESAEISREDSSPLQSLASWLLPAIVVLLFWEYKQATPGKMFISAKVVDATTFGQPTPAQWIIRYLAYYLCFLSLGLGFLWVAFDPRKQGWHDKLAGTVVIFRKHS